MAMRADKCWVRGATSEMASESDTSHLIVITGIVGLLFAYYLMR